MSQDRNQGSTCGLSVYAPGGAQGKPRVYVTCYPEDMDRYGKGLIHDLANMMDCAVYYTEDMTEEMPEDVYELLSREAYKTQCRTIGENHRWTLTTLSNIGYLLEKQDKMWRARRVYEKVYEACRRAFGESDPDTRDVRESIRKLKG